MADVRVTVSGDASGAQAAMQDTADATGLAVVKFSELTKAVQAAASMALQFAKDSVKAYMESERVTRQLERATGDLASAFEKQAQALSKKNAIDDDVIKKQQTLLAQWGAAPKDIEAATQAILDYAAATGKDAVSATQEFISSVEAGGGALKKVGVQFEATGKRTEDVRRAVAALGKQFGGAAAANADTLEGRVDSVTLAFQDLQKQFGSVVADFDSRTGVLKSIAQLLRDIGAGAAITYNALAGLFSLKGGDGKGVLRNLEEQFAKAAMGYYSGSASTPITQAAPLSRSGGTTAFGQRAFASATGDIIASGKLGEDEGTYSAWDKWQMEQSKDAQKAIDKLVADLADHSEDAWKAEAAARGQEAQGAAGLMTFILGDQKQQEKEAAEFAAKGEALGAAFVGALAAEIDKLGSGGEFDIAAFISGLLPMVGGLFGPIGAAIGGLAGAGLRLVSRKHHDGAWIGVPRFHGGGWPGMGVDEMPAVLQSGERVLSRSEVANMGGPSGVDRAARGGRGTVVVNVSALDAKSTREFFEDRGGQGFLDAARSGRGDVARLLWEGA